MKTLSISGREGKIEALLDAPKVSAFDDISVVSCHPHPLYQGTMHNKVISTISRSFNALGIEVIRFNYRGVGQSEGEYGHGEGEVEDALSVIDFIRQEKPKQKIILAGFSFGGAVAYKAQSKRDNILSLLTIAPAVVNFPLKGFQEPSMPWCVIQGTDDEVVDPTAVLSFSALQSKAPCHIIKLNEVGHFFHGKLIELRNEINAYYQPRLPLWNNK